MEKWLQQKAVALGPWHKAVSNVMTQKGYDTRLCLSCHGTRWLRDIQVSIKLWHNSLMTQIFVMACHYDDTM